MGTSAYDLLALIKIWNSKLEICAKHFQPHKLAMCAYLCVCVHALVCVCVHALVCMHKCSVFTVMIVSRYVNTSIWKPVVNIYCPLFKVPRFFTKPEAHGFMHARQVLYQVRAWIHCRHLLFSWRLLSCPISEFSTFIYNLMCIHRVLSETEYLIQ